jgi:hypothetical protein
MAAHEDGRPEEARGAAKVEAVESTIVGARKAGLDLGPAFGLRRQKRQEHTALRGVSPAVRCRPFLHRVQPYPPREPRAVKKITTGERLPPGARGVDDGCRIVRTSRGARLEQGDAVLSEILSHPGPTHGVFDLLAACVAALARGPRLAVLGFAAGGLVAPLRSMGWTGLIEGVDLSEKGPDLFRRTLGAKAGPVRIEIEEAVTWLGKHGRWDVVVEDLSIPSPGGVVKPPITLDPLPDLIRSSLTPSGIAVTNLLPVPGRSWRSLLEAVAHPGDPALVIHLEEYHNRILLTARTLPRAHEASRLVRRQLRAIGSTLAERMAVNTVAEIR